MAVCTAWLRPHGHYRRHGRNWSSCLYEGQEAAFDMAKKYAVLRLKAPKPEGGFLEAFELGLVDLNCWGDQYLDASGYPYPDEVHAFVHDWLNLSGDFKAAMRKMNDELKRQHEHAAGPMQHGQRAEPASETSGPK